MMKRAIFLVILAGAAYGQPAGKTFEVASVKRAPPPDPTQGFRVGCFPAGPGAYKCENATVDGMAFQAYGLKLYQMPNAYDDKDKFNVTAKVPPGTSPGDMLEMLRNLLAERFKLTFHYEKKEAKVFDLVVAKGGLKMKESAADAPATPAPAPGTKDAEGFQIYRRSPGSIMMPRANGLVRATGTAISMERLVTHLVTLLRLPIFDATGLIGKYDFQSTFTQESIGQNAPNSEPVAGPSIFTALETDLGLKLEPKKGTIDLFVIDHVDKTVFDN
jgi:uncharacterized protein (TIGR03435 family)